MQIPVTIVMLALSICTCSCKTSKQAEEVQGVVEKPGLIDGITETPPPVEDKPVMKAAAHTVIFKADTAYALNVPVSVTSDGSAVIYIPDPSAAKSAPVRLADGYWLATVPVTRQSMFTDYSYSDYAALSSKPSAAEIKKHLIKGERPTSIVKLPGAITDTAAINKLILSGLEGCQVVK